MSRSNLNPASQIMMYPGGGGGNTDRSNTPGPNSARPMGPSFLNNAQSTFASSSPGRDPRSSRDKSNPVVQLTGGNNSGANTYRSVTCSEPEEIDARNRAKGMMQEFMAQTELLKENQRRLDKTVDENQRLNQVAQEQRTINILEREKLNRELDGIRLQKIELEKELMITKEEMRKVAQLFAKRGEDNATNWQNKEIEIEQMERELIFAHEELRKSREEFAQVNNKIQSQETATLVHERTQQRVADLARKLLDMQKEKNILENRLQDEISRSKQTERFSETLRRHINELDDKLQNFDSLRESERARYESTISGLHREVEMQRELYQKYVEHLGESAWAPSWVEKALSTLEGDKQQLRDDHSRAEKHIKELQEEVSRISKVNSDLRKERLLEKEEMAECERNIQERYLSELSQLHKDLKEAHQNIERMESENISFKNLMVVHEEVKAARDDLTQQLFDARVKIESMKYCEKENETKYLKLESLQKLNDSLESQLKEEIALHENTRRSLVEAQSENDQKLSQIRESKKEAVREQLMTNLKQRGTSLQGNTINSNSFPLSPRSMINPSEFEAEKGQNQILMQHHEKERSRLRAEAEACNLVIEQLRQEKDMYKNQLDVIQKEVEEWKGAFKMSEQYKLDVIAEAKELKSILDITKREKKSLENRLHAVQQNITRLEESKKEMIEDMQKQHATFSEKEKVSAMKELEIKSLQFRLMEAEARKMDSDM